MQIAMSVAEEDFEVGRRVGVVARKNRALYETVKQVAKQKGKKMGDVLTEALELWRLYSTLEDVDPKSLVAAISFYEHMLNHAVEVLVKLGAVFTSEFFRTNMSFLNELAGSQQAPQAEQAPQNKPSPTELIKEQMRITMMQALLPMFMNMIQQILAVVNKTTSTQIPQTQIPLKTTTPTTRTIKVED